MVISAERQRNVSPLNQNPMKLLSSILLSFSLSIAYSIDIEQAVLSKQVTLNISSNGNGIKDGMLTLSIENMTKSSIQIELPCGQVFICEDDPRQNLILVKEELIALKPLEKQGTKLTVMCIEANDMSPGEAISYTIGPKAEGDLYKIARYINENRIFNFSGQEAIWVFSDNHEIGWINPISTKESELRMFAAKLKGVDNPWYTTNHNGSGNHQLSDNYVVHQPMEERYDMTTAEINGNFNWKLAKSTQITFAVYNNNGEAIRTFFNDKPFSPGELSLHFHYRATHIPRGKYIARMTQGDELIAEKEFSF